MRNDRRGDRLADLAASLYLLVANSGTIPTYRRCNAESIIDVTFHRTRPPFVLRGWKVLEEAESASDHNYLQFRLDKDVAIEENPERLRGWSYRRLNSDALAAHLATAPLPRADEHTSTDEAAQQLTEYLASACDACMPPRRNPASGRRQVHWWNAGIKTLHEDCAKLRRKYQRACRRHETPDLIKLSRAAHAGKRKDLRNAVRTSQEKSWSELCAAVDSDPWGLPYKVVTKRIGSRRSGIEARGRESEIADHLFPNPPQIDWSLEPPPLEQDDDGPPALEWTLEELRDASTRLPPCKAPGPDGIPNEFLAKVAVLRPLSLLKTYNSCLAHSTFPS
ncbi:uncharacterized protein LOC132953336 [Metopolophium dirhodum]|uniref:uncharacterized protein LOC132953336 n=1 Tax=Metopolophium dirhodum TaxID=44670 RepID=UPI00298FEBB7|nr:uncharacterized protein LOC132953336 [Metopolophium dirhodum]